MSLGEGGGGDRVGVGKEREMLVILGGGMRYVEYGSRNVEVEKGEGVEKIEGRIWMYGEGWGGGKGELGDSVVGMKKDGGGLGEMGMLWDEMGERVGGGWGKDGKGGFVMGGMG